MEIYGIWYLEIHEIYAPLKSFNLKNDFAYSKVKLMTETHRKVRTWGM